MARKTKQIKCMSGPEWKSKSTGCALSILSKLMRIKLVYVLFLVRPVIKTTRKQIKHNDHNHNKTTVASNGNCAELPITSTV